VPYFASGCRVSIESVSSGTVYSGDDTCGRWM
jgi:hypothetical protein